MGEREERLRVVMVALSWVGTPYHDCARIKGAGVDCAMLVAAVFEEAGIEPPIDIPRYSPQWYLHQDAELYLEKVLSRAVETTELEAKPGDVVLYKFGRCFAHGGIIIDPGWPYIVHAYKPSRMVLAGDGSMGDLAHERLKGNTHRPRPRRFFTRQAWRAA